MVIATLALIVTIFITNNIFARIYHQLKVWQESYIHPVRFGNWELIRANQLDDLITWLAWLAQAAIILGLLVAYFPFVLKQFPWTRGLAKTFEGYLVGTLQAGWQAFVTYLPSLLTIALVVVVTYFLLNLSKPFFRELSEQALIKFRHIVFPPTVGFKPPWKLPYSYAMLVTLVKPVAYLKVLVTFSHCETPLSPKVQPQVRHDRPAQLSAAA